MINILNLIMERIGKHQLENIVSGIKGTVCVNFMKSNNKEQSKEYYDKVYSREKTPYHRPFDKVKLYNLWKLINISADYRILDVGCGVGQFAEYLRHNGIRKYTGIDFSEVAIEEAKLRVPVEPPICKAPTSIAA